MTGDDLTTESTVYVTYIACTPEQAWHALTTGDVTAQYFFGHRVTSTWQIDAPWSLHKADGTLAVHGIVRAAEPPHKLVVTWKVEGPPEIKSLPECIVSYDLEPIAPSIVRLTMTEAHPTPLPAHLLEGGRRGWPMILSGLKTLLETGKPLGLPLPGPPRK